MGLSMWNSAFAAVADCFLSMFGFFFQVIGAATAALLALTIIGAVVRLIVRPIMGYTFDISVTQPVSEKIKNKINDRRERKKYGVK